MIAILLAATVVQMSVADLTRLCSSSVPSCRLFVAGVIEGAHVAAGQVGLVTRFCAGSPKDVTDVADRVLAVVTQDVREHPADQRLAAAAMVAAISEQMHPCH